MNKSDIKFLFLICICLRLFFDSKEIYGNHLYRNKSNKEKNLIYLKSSLSWITRNKLSYFFLRFNQLIAGGADAIFMEKILKNGILSFREFFGHIV